MRPQWEMFWGPFSHHGAICFDPIGKPAFSVKPVVPFSLGRQVTASVGQNVILKCHGGKDSINAYRWKQCVSTGCGALQTQTGKYLRFRPVKLSNAGDYECDHGHHTPGSKRLKLVVNTRIAQGECIPYHRKPWFPF